jgi:hypothetical protein
MTTRYEVQCDGVVIGTYPTRDDAVAHAQKHARNTYGKEIEGWKRTESGESAKIPGEPAVQYAVTESTSGS